MTSGAQPELAPVGAARPPARVPSPRRNGSIFFRLVTRAMFVGRRRMAIAFVALALGATLASGLLTTYADLEQKMAGELRGFGANIAIAPGDSTPGTTLPEDIAASLGFAETLPVLYAAGQVNGEPAILAGLRFDRLGAFARAWHWQGRTPCAGQTAGEACAEAAAGERLAAHFRLAPGSPDWGLPDSGSRLKVAYGGNAIQLQITAIVATGSSEDSQLLLPLAALQRLTRLEGRASLVQVIAAGGSGAVEEARTRAAARLGPAVEVRAIRQVAESSARVLLKVKWMLFAVSGLVLGAIGLCVMTTLSGIVLERRKDIAVMKALGGTPAHITALFLGEAAALAFAGGVLGYLAGAALARLLGNAVFSVPVALRGAVLPQVLLVTVLLALLATVVPLRLVRAVEPAAILKGE